MANEVLKGIAQDIKAVDVAIEEAEDLISAMKEAGEPIAELEMKLREGKIRKVKWLRMLENRGISGE